jgi:transcriptional regulator with XRE-family HTH domain
MMREQAELTQADVAEALGCSQAAVCRYEAGQRVPRGDVAVRYLSLLRRAAGAD